MQPRAVLDERRGTLFVQKQSRERMPQESDGGHPLDMRQGLDRAEFDQAAAAALEGGVPEFVEADLAAVRVARSVGMQVTQRFADEQALVAPRLQFFKKLVGHLQVVKLARGFVGPRGLRGRPT